jgi:hypothetical protein
MGGQEIDLSASAEHVELTADHLVIGMVLSWHNRTAAPISIKDMQLHVALPGRGKEPLRFYPLERFERVPQQRALIRKPVRPFTIPAHQEYAEQVRFISQEVLDIPAGRYGAAIEVKDIGDVCYTNEFTLRVDSQIRYRRSEEWEHD